MEQRAADGYLKVLSLAEQEAQWLDSRVYNLGLDRKELEYGVVSPMKVSKPELTDRATASALIRARTHSSCGMASGSRCPCPGDRRRYLQHHRGR